MDLIDRQVAVDAIQQHREDVLGGYEYDEGVAFVYAAAHNHIIDVIKHLPSAQSEQQWVSVTEMLPEDDTEVIVSCTDDSGDSEFSYTTTGWHFKGLWVVGNERSCFVRAWQPLPGPWKGEE